MAVLIRHWPALGVVLLLASPPSFAQAPAAQSLPVRPITAPAGVATRPAANACARTDVDMSRLPPDAFAPLTLKQTPATHLRLRKAAGLNLNLGAPIVRVRTALGGGIALAGGWDSTWAHKDRRGVWVVESVQELTSYFGRPPAHGYSVQVGVMPAQAAQELEAILADDCLYREPTAIGPQWPSVLSPRDKARGLDGHNSCSDGGATLIEVEYGGRRFAASHACITHGAVSRIISLIHEAR